MPRSFIAFFTYFAIFNFLFSAPASADFILHHWEDLRSQFRFSPDRLGLGFEIGSYSTHNNFDPLGRAYIPSGLINYQRYQADLTAYLNASEKIGIYFRGTWEKVNLTHLTNTGSSYGLGDQSIGLNWNILDTTNKSKKGIFKIDLQIQDDFSAYSNSSAYSNGIPFLGDGSSDITAGIFLSLLSNQKALHQFKSTLGMGYTYRNSQYSKALPWSAQLDYEYRGFQSGSLYLAGGFNGIASLKTDSTLYNGSQTSPGTGGSFISNAINPTLVNITGKIGYLSREDLDFSISTTQAVFGYNSPLGFQINFGFQTHFGHAKKAIYPEDIEELNSLEGEPEKSNRGFVMYYNIDGKVLKTNPNLNLIKIDKGSQSGVAVGDSFDIFELKPDNTIDTAVARGIVTKVTADDAIIKINEFYKEVWIQEGFLAKRPITTPKQGKDNVQ